MKKLLTPATVSLFETTEIFKKLPLNKETPIYVQVFKDRIEITVLLKTSRNNYKTFNKTFAYDDLLLMNKVLNQIMRGEQK